MILARFLSDTDREALLNSGRSLRRNSGPALSLNLAVLMCVSIASVLSFTAGSGVLYSTAISLFFNGLLVWGALGIGILTGKLGSGALR
jgi:hypothetical protein